MYSKKRVDDACDKIVDIIGELETHDERMHTLKTVESFFICEMVDAYIKDRRGR